VDSQSIFDPDCWEVWPPVPSGPSLTQEMSQLMDEIAAGAHSPSHSVDVSRSPEVCTMQFPTMAGGAGTPTDIYSHDELIDETAVVARTPTAVSSLDELIDETAVECTTTEVDSDGTLTPTEVDSHEPAPTKVYSHEPMPTGSPESPEGSNSRQWAMG